MFAMFSNFAIALRCSTIHLQWHSACSYIVGHKDFCFVFLVSVVLQTEMEEDF